jgi:hypothetical protein
MTTRCNPFLGIILPTTKGNMPVGPMRIRTESYRIRTWVGSDPAGPSLHDDVDTEEGLTLAEAMSLAKCYGSQGRRWNVDRIRGSRVTVMARG